MTASYNPPPIGTARASLGQFRSLPRLYDDGLYDEGLYDYESITILPGSSAIGTARTVLPPPAGKSP